ncbi:hypothetical protein [Haloimpatiens massiliensis]|uniref:hypothetical protein n=1 Tax=Haloimpatiens massiliensis TaxID=1658110 RepID=UPI000C825657|nr:hypothetical protein [Haloimpatiens massiliensis]
MVNLKKLRKGGDIIVTFIVILNVILAIVSTVLIIRNFLVKYKGSESGFKNFVFIAFIIVALMCALGGAWQGMSTKGKMEYLINVKEIPKEKVEMLKVDIQSEKSSIKKSSVTGYICLIGGYLLLLNIKREKKKQLEEEKKKYNWSKI